jgi:hypothetical protein
MACNSRRCLYDHVVNLGSCFPSVHTFSRLQNVGKSKGASSEELHVRIATRGLTAESSPVSRAG